MVDRIVIRIQCDNLIVDALEQSQRVIIEGRSDEAPTSAVPDSVMFGPPGVIGPTRTRAAVLS